MEFLIISVLFVLIERVRPWRRGQSLVRAHILTDLLHWGFNGYLFYLLGYGLVTGYIFTLFGGWMGSAGLGNLLDSHLLTGLPIWLQCAILFVILDFMMWCTHNLLHRVPFLWELHKVHHSIVTMDWIGNMRYHWGETVLYQLVLFAPRLLLGADPIVSFYLGMAGTVIGHFNHSNVNAGMGPLRYIFNSPRMHIWHHDKDGPASHNKNFGIGLSVWDWLFGTAYYPAADEPQAPELLGFEGIESFPGNFFGQQLLPISRSWRKSVPLMLLVVLGLVTACAGEEQRGEIVVHVAQKSITFTGKIYPGQFNSWRTWPKNHHFIVWKGGGASGKALIQADANDLEIQRALEKLGARAGNNLTLDSWEKRKDEGNPDPDLHVTGTLIDVSIAWAGHAPVRAGDILVDKGGHGFEFRLGGHEKFIPVWKSGCIVCLESCPGGRVSNARYTLRDYQKDIAVFELRKDLLPKDGTDVTITLAIR
ncbi:MAG: sterol desaturase family protein [Candidatus Kapaibacterium sp.]